MSIKAKHEKNNKLVAILGPTASGKTDLSVKLAKKFGGEIISADSRQVYKGLDVGSGKITKKEMRGIPHYLLSVANPKKRFSVVQYQKLALKAIKNIQKHGKLPMLVGGTGFYIQSIVDGTVIPEVKPNWALRAKLEKIALPKLFKRLQKLDPVRAGNIDQNNPRRVVRALEVVTALRGPVPTASANIPPWDALQIGISKTPNQLKKLIKKRLIKKIKPTIAEVKKLHKLGLSWSRLEEFGLEYRFVAQYIQGELSYQEMIDAIQIESQHYAKRQMTWFKRDKRIHWVKNYKTAEKLIKNY